MSAYELVCDTLAARGSKFRDRRQSHSMWQCPAHEDKNPSLSVDDRNGRAVLHCHAHCQNDDVIEALGLQWADLFDEPIDVSTVNKSDRPRNILMRSYLYEKVDGAPWFWVDRYYPKTFRQRRPDVEPVHDLADVAATTRLGLGKSGRTPIPYHAPQLWQALAKGDAVVWWLDGEKDVETAAKHGLLATCPPGFAKWDPRYAQFLKAAASIVMVVDQDKVKPDGSLGAGQSHAVQARLGFRAVGLTVKVVSPCEGKDLTDHFAAGCGPDDFRLDPILSQRPRGLTAPALMAREFAPIRWAIRGMLPTGLTIFAAAPKVGKSWICLDISCAVAAGGWALGAVETVQGSVLYVAREDTYRRAQSRLQLLVGGSLDDVPAALEVVPQEVEWVGGEEGLAHLSDWAEEVGDPALVVLDTIGKIEPEMGGNGKGNAYSGDYTMMARYKEWADTHNVAVVAVHHDAKGSANDRTKVGMANDPFSKISGTRGLTGAADTLWFLETVRGTKEGELHITGRDVVEQPIEMHKVGPVWQANHRPDLA